MSNPEINRLASIFGENSCEIVSAVSAKTV
jgi:hypothetical protein